MNVLSLLQESETDNDPSSNDKLQARLMAESEMVSTGLLKFDIFEETDRNLENFAGHPILEDNPLTTSEINK